MGDFERKSPAALLKTFSVGILALSLFTTVSPGTLGMEQFFRTSKRQAPLFSAKSVHLSVNLPPSAFKSTAE
jgi:hypothetical protein